MPHLTAICSPKLTAHMPAGICSRRVFVVEYLLKLEMERRAVMRYTECYEVTSHDVDVNNNIKPSLLLRYMQETANHQMRDRKPSYYDFFFEGKSFIVTRITMEIYAQLHQFDRIEVDTWRCPAKGVTFLRCFEIRRGGEVAARAYSVWAVTEHASGRLCRVSEIDISNYELEDALSLTLPTRFRLPRDCAYSKAGSREIFFSDVDMNRHMNNTNYPDMLWNFIPDVMDKQVTSINLRFMKEAPLGAVVDIYRTKLAGPLPQDAEAEETWCFYSLVDGQVNVEAEIGMKRLAEKA